MTQITNITKQEFSRRRKALMEHMAPNSVAILPAASEKIRNRDAHYAFRQESDFYYLSGFPEPEAVLVVIPGGGCIGYPYTSWATPRPVCRWRCAHRTHGDR